MHCSTLTALILLLPLNSLAFPTLPFNLPLLRPRQYGAPYGSGSSGTWLPNNYASGSTPGCSHYGANGECGGASIDTDPTHFNDPATLLGQPDDHTQTALPLAGGTTSLDSFLSEAAAATATASAEPSATDDADVTETTSAAESESTSAVRTGTSVSVTAMASMTAATTAGGASQTSAAAPSSSSSSSGSTDSTNGASARDRCGVLGALAMGVAGVMAVL